MQNPILKALSTVFASPLKVLLMGGQACILYGAAEFSRDIDLALMVEQENISRLRQVLKLLDAEPIYVPDLSEEALRAGHACHFRCRAEEVRGVRLDIMGGLRGEANFDELWARRVAMKLPEAGVIQVMALPDLVRAKKTQRDKDWPMIRRLVEADLSAAVEPAPPGRVRFWLEECRTPELLIELARRFPEKTAALTPGRPLLQAAAKGEAGELGRSLREEEEREREADRLYWAPRRAQLEAWQREKR